MWFAVAGDSDAYGMWRPSKTSGAWISVTFDDLGEGDQLGEVEDAPERVVGVAEQDRAGALGEGPVEGIEVVRRASVDLRHRDVDLGATGQLDDVEERHVDRRRDDDRVVARAERLEGERHPAHDVGDEEDVRGVAGPVVPPGQVRDEDLGEAGRPGVQGVAEGLGVHGSVQRRRDGRGRRVVHLRHPHREDVVRLAGPFEGPAGPQRVRREGLEVDGHALSSAAASGLSVRLNVRR